jgi:nicotinate-nucleotide pyrophosphorylase (carboxylating)
MIQWTAAETHTCDELIRLALVEDLGDRGDLTSALLPEELQGRALLKCRVSGVLAGLPAVEATYRRVGPGINITPHQNDGQALQPGSVIATITGPIRTLLSGERTALNFLQRLSGVATLTKRYTELLADLPCKLLDTRKTTPGWRLLEKYAVRCGGGHNHRLGLFDGVLIKDNHLAALRLQSQPIRHAVALARQRYGQQVFIEVEVDSLEQLAEALAAPADMILLDNMDLATLRQAVQMRNSRAVNILLEASGGVTLATLRSIAETGVDRISVGALTHSATALDIALDYDLSTT